MSISVLSQTATRSGQDVDYTEVLVVETSRTKHVLRVRIRSNSYREQCHALIERWDGARWNELSTIHSGGMATRHALYVAIHSDKPANLLIDEFDDDRGALVDAALDVLQVNQ